MAPFDVVVLGEVLLEISTSVELADGVDARLGFSGDALNIAAAAASAGASVGLIAVLGDDEVGTAIRRRVAGLGISTRLLASAPGRQGAYLVHSDPTGEREFTYLRSGSVGATLAPELLDEDELRSAGAVVTTGITDAISPSARLAVDRAARLSARFVYDPNHRPRLASAGSARDRMMELAPHCALITPSHPVETGLLGADTPSDAARLLRAAGAGSVAVTCGSRGVHVESEAGVSWAHSVPAPTVVDQTGAGDAFLGATTARLVGGDTLLDAVGYGVAAASLVVGGRGGTGVLPSAAEVLAHRRTAPPSEVP